MSEIVAKIRRGYVDETKIPPEEREKYWCESCCNFDRERAGPDGYAFCKLTETQTFGQTFAANCRGFNVPYCFVDDMRIQKEVPTDIQLVIHEDVPFLSREDKKEHRTCTIGMKLTYCGQQYGDFLHFSVKKLSNKDIASAVPQLITRLLSMIFSENSIEKQLEDIRGCDECDFSKHCKKNAIFNRSL